MKFGILNHESIICQAHSERLRVYVQLGYSERGSRKRPYQTTVIGAVAIYRKSLDSCESEGTTNEATVMAVEEQPLVRLQLK